MLGDSDGDRVGDMDVDAVGVVDAEMDVDGVLVPERDALSETLLDGVGEFDADGNTTTSGVALNVRLPVPNWPEALAPQHFRVPS